MVFDFEFVYRIRQVLLEESDKKEFRNRTIWWRHKTFSGEGPSWPEAELTKEWGKKVANKYGLTFYFPSDTEPDDDCPDWTQKHLAVNCAECNKLIIPTDSNYLPKDICYNCH